MNVRLSLTKHDNQVNNKILVLLEVVIQIKTLEITYCWIYALFHQQFLKHNF